MSVLEQKKPIIAYDDFVLQLEGPITISMPPYPEVTAQDIDAQLFSYISNAPKGSKLVSLNDLDDAWVQANLPEVRTIDELRTTIKARLEQENVFSYQDTKYARVADVLVECLQGDISQDLIDAERDGIREQNLIKIHAGGETLFQYLKRQDMSEAEYEQHIEEETRYQIALSIALTKYVQEQEISVSEDDLTSYLGAENPEVFLQTIKKNNRVEEAQQAAARVKAMRQLIDETEINIMDGHILR